MGDDARLDEILLTWRERCAEGTYVDPEEVIGSHPELADRLRKRFRALMAIDEALAESALAEGAPRGIGPYRILRELGSGGMGTVYAAESDGGPVALKVIHPHLLSGPGFFKRFLREAETGRRIQHENVVQTLDADALEVDGQITHFLVMEYVEGQTLRGLLDELSRVPEELCRHIGREVAKGLCSIHEAGILHRDIKPENVLITADHTVKVMDLGVARLQDEALRLSQTGAFVGSIEYAAPEQFRSRSGEPDGRADLHALGVMLYELATGQHPYRADTAHQVMRNIIDEEPRRPGEVNPQLSPYFEEVLLTLVAKDPAQRFESSNELLDVLEAGEESPWWSERARALRIQTKHPLRRIRIPRETTLYGRDDELARLKGLFEKADSGDGQVLLVEGEAGIGKTRLVDEFVGALREEGEDVNFLFGSYPPGGAATATGAFSEAYREQFGAEGLEDVLASYLSSTPILIPAFAAVLKGETTPKGADPLNKDSLQTVFVHATRALAAERTTIVLIDDLHFAPEEGRALFASLALAVPGHRILLLGTMRSGVPEDWIANVERQEYSSRMVLPRLGPKDLSALLKDAFRSERLADELGWKIAQKSDGNPFFIFEIIRGLREGQFISQQPDGTWVTTAVIEDIKVPSSVLDLVNARIVDLSQEDRDLLDVAACLGFEFEAGVVADAIGMARVPALKRFGQIERGHRLVRTAGRKCVFDHHQVQEALYGSLMHELKEEYHFALAKALEARAGAADADPEILDGTLCVALCEHYLTGAHGERAIRYMDAALSHLQGGYMNEQAVALADRVLTSPGLLEGARRVQVLSVKSGCLDLLGRRAAQEEVLEEMIALAEAEGLQHLLADATRAMGWLLYVTGRPDTAKACLARALATYRESANRAGEADAIMVLANVFRSVGRYEEAKAHNELSILTWRETGHRAGEANALMNLGVACFDLRHYAEAKAHQEQALGIWREVGHRRGEAGSLVNLGLILLSLDHTEEAREHLERSLVIFREVGDRRGQRIALGNLGELWAALGERDRARQNLNSALSVCHEMGDRYGASHALPALASLADEEDEAQEARRLARASTDLRRESGNEHLVAESLLVLGSLELRAGRTEEARAALEEALGLLRQQNRKPELAHALTLLANLPGGDAAEAEAALEEAGEAGNTPQTRYYLWKATGKPEHLAEAERLLDYRVEHAPEEYRDSMLKNVRLHREIMEAWEKHGGKA